MASEELNEEAVEETTPDQDYDAVFYAEENEAPEPEEDAEPEEDQPEDETEGEEEEAPAEEDDSNDTEDEDSEDDQPEVTPGEEEGDLWTLKWRGQEIKATKEEVINMAQRNFDATHKYQEAAKLRKQTEKELELLERVRKGDKEALARLAKEANVDPIDLIDVEVGDLEQGEDQQSEPFVSPEVDVLMQEVAQDEELFGKLQNVETALPEPVINAMAKDPETFYTVISEVKSGDAEIVLPHVQKALAQMDNVDRAVVTSNPDAYAQFYLNVKQELIQASQPKEETPVPEKKNYADAAVRRSGNRSKKSRKPVEENAFESDEAYQKILDRLAQQQ